MTSTQPHLLYLAWGFPPAAKSCAYRKLATANSFARHGWRVTVVTLTEDAWIREHGLDPSLLPLVDDGIEIVRLPLYRDDLSTDIRSYSRLRAQQPIRWRKLRHRRDKVQFPEAVFGPWRHQLEREVSRLHHHDPADLLLTSAAPYTFFAPALRMSRRHYLPFVLDYRDAWALDIINDKEAFPIHSRRGRIEKELIDRCVEAWFVNSPIRDYYAERYPVRARKLHVVRNGSDVAVSTPHGDTHQPDPERGVTIGYLGTVSFPPTRTKALCEGWRIAAQRDPLVARSHLEFRGHIGAGSARGANGHTRILSQYEKDGVRYGGPVPKGETAALYASWDALLLSLVGGRFVTSGKVFDYVATGMPIMSAHEADHAATEILDGYPLWIRNDGLDAEALADAFIRTAHLAVETGPAEREKARHHADQFERYRQIDPAVARLTEKFAEKFRTDDSPDDAPDEDESTDQEATA